MPFSSPSILILIAVNLVPLAGVLFYGWTVFELLALFWAENVVIGVLNVVKMATVLVFARRTEALFTIPFFCVHYGMFAFVHGLFVFEMFKPPGEIDYGVFAFPLAALALSHVVSFALNFIGRGEFRTLTAGDLMAQPYGRVVVLHVTILAGGFLVAALGQPIGALVLLVAIKTGVDVFAHMREHTKALERSE